MKALVLVAVLAAFPASALGQSALDIQQQQQREADARTQETQRTLREFEQRQQLAELERAQANLELRLKTDENLRRMEAERRELRLTEQRLADQAARAAALHRAAATR